MEQRVSTRINVYQQGATRSNKEQQGATRSNKEQQGATRSNTYQCGAMQSNLLPESRKECFDRNLLQRLGIYDAQMKDNDDLFLYKLILPIFPMRKSGIRKDMRKVFYSEADK